MMKLSIKRFTLTCSLLWGASVFFVSVLNFIFPHYAVAFLEVISSVYPGYTIMQGWSSIICGTLYAIVDGAIGGAIFTWLYNVLPD